MAGGHTVASRRLMAASRSTVASLTVASKATVISTVATNIAFKTDMASLWIRPVKT